AARGTWTSTDTMSGPRFDHTATLLRNGKVLVAGGDPNAVCGPSYTFQFSPIASAELYDPSTGTWSITGPMTTARCMHTATLLPNGKVLVAGGAAGAGNDIASAELYDPSTGTWSTTGTMTISRSLDTATLLPNANAPVAGGHAGPGPAIASAEMYDPSTGTWSTTGPMETARSRHAATLLPNGKVL